MLLMCSSHSSSAFHDLAKQHPGQLGWLLGPMVWKNPRPHLPYALDNDAYTHWKNGTQFDVEAWHRMLDKAQRQQYQPLWALVPDSVGNRDETLRMWDEHSQTVISAGFNPAFAVQDGMTSRDVPRDSVVVFVGGGTSWKWRTAAAWCSEFPRVHIGRVNGIRRLWIAQRIGAESCDGTGYFRSTPKGPEARKLKAWLHHKTDPQHELMLAL